ncbi:DNA topoisomerase [Malassezia yamatoensis]|uniref:DNA topoisomerase 1 n=1 Tax=Malassezia yamatoensis TaxID=253288 RepID=A0AAJ5Z1Z3_9BASI|nr:DNA topoisomerase [Malassezia yamatoensis]
MKKEQHSSDSDEPMASQQQRDRSDSPLVKQLKNSDSDDENEDDDDDDAEDDDDDQDDGKSQSKRKRTGQQSQLKSDIEGGGEDRWNTLVHKGPRFPEPYKPLPSEITLKYEGQPVSLPPESEEVAMFYAVKLETQHAQNPTFNQNFFEDFCATLKKFPPRNGVRIKKFDKLDFRDMHNYWKSLKDAEAERKKSMAPSARKAETAARKAIENQYKTCLVDGVEQKAGNVTVEPPGLFLGRGAHPKAGRVKTRIMPEQITINHSANFPAPEPPKGHQWGEVVEKKDVTWLALWRENINGGFKYVFLDASSNFKTESDREKFEKARRLDQCVKRVRADVLRNLTSKNRLDRMVATIVWLIDNFSLRAGNEKGEDEAETYGVCSLRCGHATLIMPNQLKLSFLGKDSMKFEETLSIGNKQVFNNITMFLKTDGTKVNGTYLRKGPDDPIFAAPKAKSSKMTPLSPDAVNQFLGQYMKGLSAKVFRTYNASVTFQGLLDQTEQWLASRPTPQERDVNPSNLRIAYNEANRQVAILCNHQKTVNHVVLGKALDRTKEKIFALQYQIFKEQQKLLTFHKPAELKKEFLAKDHAFASQWDLLLQDLHLDMERVQQHEEQLIADKKNRMTTAFERQESERKYQEELRKENQLKSEEQDEKPARITSREQLNEELRGLDLQLKVLERERKKNRSEATSCNVPSTARKILNKYEAIKKQEAELTNKSNTSDVSLGTSKINYIDPRITISWLKKWDMQLQKIAPQKKTKVKTESKEAQAANSATSEKMELHLQVMNIGQFFPMTLQKKFRWAAFDDDGKDISARWSFVKDATKKMRTLESGSRKEDTLAL